MNTDKIILWSDSSTVLTWFAVRLVPLQGLMGIRVAEIQELTAESIWHYVDSAQNPADDVTRGKTLAELALPNRWSQGPSFLSKGPAEWPSSPGEIPEQDITEYNKMASYGVISRADRQEAHGGQPYLSWKNMVEAVAQEMHGAADQDEPLTVEDYRQAEMTVFQRIQSECFPVELRHLKAGKAVLRSSRLLTPSPELDPDEEIRTS